MTNQTKALLTRIYAELDEKVPGWRSAHSNFDAAVRAAGDRATELSKLADEYRLTMKQLARAVPTLPKPRILDECESLRDRDVSVFDAGPCGRHVSAERSIEVSGIPPYAEQALTDRYDSEDAVEPRAMTQARYGRAEDSLYYPDGRPHLAASNLAHRDIPYRWPHTPPREGAVYGNRCW